MTSSHRIEPLDGLRAIAIVWVIFFHAWTLWPSPPPHWLTGFIIGSIVRWGGAVVFHGQFGVEIFFVLSGFLITTLLLREEGSRGEIDLKAFYIRRAFRILPPAMAYLGVIAVLASVGISPAGKDLLSAALFARNFFIGSSDTNHFWTLAIEEQFYLLWPILLVLLPRRIRLRVVVAMILALAVFRHEFSRLFPHTTLMAFQFHYDGLLVGSLLALIRNGGNIAALLDHRLLVGDGIVLVAAIGIAVLLSPAAKHLGKNEQLIVPETLSLLVAVVVNAVLPRPSARRSSLSVRLLSFRPIVWIGLLSYSLYLWQQPFCVAKSSLPLPIPLCMLAATAAAVGSFFLIERPSLKMRQRLFRSERVVRSMSVLQPA